MKAAPKFKIGDRALFAGAEPEKNLEFYEVYFSPLYQELI